MRISSILLLLLCLAGCAKAVSQTPTISATELAEEQRAQRAIIEAEQKRTAQQTGKQKTAKQLLARLEPIANKVTTAGKQICLELYGTKKKCEYPFAIDTKSKAVNAYTDGKKIIVTPAMMAFAYDDTQLATVLSHEFAHAIMDHPQKTQQNASLGGLLGMAVDTLARSQGFNTGGAFSKIGTQGAVLKYSQGFEKEADYIGLYILQRSGYDTSKAATLWRRMATLNPDGIYTGSTHPTTAERYVLLKKTATEIATKKKSGKPLLPERLPEE